MLDQRQVRTYNKLSFSRNDIAGLTIAVAAIILRLKCAEAAVDKNEVQIKVMDIVSQHNPSTGLWEVMSASHKWEMS